MSQEELMSDDALKKYEQAADFFVKVSRKFLATEKGLHAETLIMGTARMAGTLLLQSFDIATDTAPGSVLLSRQADAHGPMLMNLMIAALQSVGHKDFAERSIDPGYQFAENLQLDLEQTQAKLGLFFSKYRETAGLTLREAAMAAATATAINIHDCRAGLDIRKGACIAVHGFIEGVKTVPYPFKPNEASGPAEPALPSLSPEDLCAGLAGVYRDFVKIVYANLALIKVEVESPMRPTRLLPDTLAKMKPLPLMQTSEYLARNTEGSKGVSFLFGEFNADGGFQPSLSTRMLYTACVGQSINTTLKQNKPVELAGLRRQLQQLLLDCFFLARVLHYLSQKTRLIDGKLENLTINKEALSKAYLAYAEAVKTDFPRVTACCTDLEHVDHWAKNNRCLDYAWTNYRVESEGRVINHYFLPKVCWEPFMRDNGYMGARS